MKSKPLTRLEQAERSQSATTVSKRREIRQLLNLPEDATEAEVLQGYLEGIALSVEAYESTHGIIVPRPLDSISLETLSSISDADLMVAYKRALDQSGVTAAQSTTVPANPTPAEIRELLVANGMTRADADTLSDEELKKLYADTLNTPRKQESKNP